MGDSDTRRRGIEQLIDEMIDISDAWSAVQKSVSGKPPTGTPLTNQAPSGSNGVQIMIQGTAGSILVQACDGQTWMKLAPDAKGSYIDGTWSTLASEPVARLYFASQILTDGRLFVAGGEYSGPGLLPNWSNTGEIYDPLSNAWTRIAPYPDQPGCPFVYYVSGNTTSGSAEITGIYPYTTGLAVGEQVFGSGIPSSATIVSVDSPTQITISSPASETVATNVITFNSYYQLTGCLGDNWGIVPPAVPAVPSVPCDPAFGCSRQNISRSLYRFRLAGRVARRVLFEPVGELQQRSSRL